MSSAEWYFDFISPFAYFQLEAFHRLPPERDGVPPKFPKEHPFNPIKALRLAIAAGDRLEPVRTIFRHIWREGATDWSIRRTVLRHSRVSSICPESRAPRKHPKASARRRPAPAARSTRSCAAQRQRAQELRRTVPEHLDTDAEQ